ncbi:hypothetical protein PIB30_046787 [Stylosanthes scabra]|uniref:Uncharacterized protein n=1 Tax=Stylosanthes scabra TaxID=79078 RepID=A0ABU6ZFB9_9FABA|nr:hypothetical protein [Stylosanthes scabra]
MAIRTELIVIISTAKIRPLPGYTLVHRGPCHLRVWGSSATKFENIEYWTQVVLPRKQKQRKLEEQETEFWSISGQSPTPRCRTQRLGVQVRSRGQTTHA